MFIQMPTSINTNVGTFVAVKPDHPAYHRW